MIHETSSSFFYIVFALSHLHFAHSVRTVTSYPILQAPNLSSPQSTQHVFQIHLGLHRCCRLSFFLCLILLLPAHLRHHSSCITSSCFLSSFLLFSCFLSLFFYLSPLLPLSYAYKSNTFFFHYPSFFIKNGPQVSGIPFAYEATSIICKFFAGI